MRNNKPLIPLKYRLSLEFSAAAKLGGTGDSNSHWLEFVLSYTSYLHSCRYIYSWRPHAANHLGKDGPAWEDCTALSQKPLSHHREGQEPESFVQFSSWSRLLCTCLACLKLMLCSIVRGLFHFSRELHSKRRHGNFKYISAPTLKAKDALQTPQQNVLGDRKPLYCLWEVAWSGFMHLAKIHC